MNLKPFFWIGGGVVVLVAAMVAWYLASPLFLNTVVDEAQPAVTASEAPFASGQFAGVSRYDGAGTAVFFREGEQLLLRFEEFMVTNGPDLHVILSKNADPTGPDGLGDDYIDLGELKGNQGNQNYEIPANIDLSQYRSIVIYCEPFHVVFAVAALGGG